MKCDGLDDFKHTVLHEIVIQFANIQNFSLPPNKTHEK